MSRHFPDTGDLVIGFEILAPDKTSEICEVRLR